MDISSGENQPAGAYRLSSRADISRPMIGGHESTIDGQNTVNRGSEFGQPKMFAPQVKKPDGLNRHQAQDVDESSGGGAISADGGNTTR